MNDMSDTITHEASLIGEEEATTIWNMNGPVPASIQECIHTLFEARAAENPDAPAVDAWDGRLTYGELEQQSARLACDLSRSGVGPEVVVPLLFEKSIWTPVAMLGVLKAGGAFVPLDVNQPEDRLRQVVEQCEARVVCASERRRELCSRIQAVAHIVGPEWWREKSENEAAVPLEPNPSWPMYVCFTSGSTGKPKGIVITHSAFSSARHYQADAFCFHPGARVFDFASYSFDVAVYNAMMTLSIGACLCIPSEEQRIGKLNQTLRSMAVTMAALTPSASRLLEPESLPNLQTLILSGEAVSHGDLERLRRGSFRVLNAYGPAECTPMSTLNSHAITSGTSINIGKAIGALTWVVNPNDHTKLVPRGTTGELLLEGPILAREYMKEPEKTEAAFINDPPWLLRGARSWPGRHGRLYKTGDLVSFDTDGNLHFVGRKDAQVKLHGQRLEPGEVEHHLRRCMSADDKFIVDVIELGGEKSRPMLTAFLTGQQGWSDSKLIVEGLELVHPHEDVEAALKRALPSYMVPTLYLRIPAIPLASTGKADRRRLRAMGATISPQRLAELRVLARQGAEPRTDNEFLLRGLWANVLDIDATAIGLDDDFFRLGGDSLAAIRLVGAIGKVGYGLTVAAIFGNPSLGSQARLLTDAVTHNSEPIPPFALLESKDESPHIRRTLAELCNLADSSMVEDAYPCTPLQAGIFSLGTKRDGDYVLQAVLEIHDNCQIDRFKASWEEILQQTTVLRTRIVEQAKLGLLQVICKQDVQWLQANDLDSYLAEDSLKPMGLGDALSRFALVGDVAKPRWFVWTVHHVLYDGWSLQQVTNLAKQVFLGNANRDAIAQRPNFNSFVSHILKDGVERMNMEAYWESYFANSESATFPALPMAVREPVANATLEFSLPSRTRTGVTLSTMLRAALGLVMSHHTGTTDVIFGSIVSGRTAPVAGIEDILGPTIATVPVRVQSPNTQTVSEYVNSVQRDMTEMIPHEQIGLQRLAKLSKEGRDACRFQTLLVVQPQKDEIESDNVFGEWQTSSTQQRFSTYAITLECFIMDGEVQARASFDTRVVDEWRMGQILRQLGTVLDQLAAAPADRTIGEIELLTTKDKSVISGWNNHDINVVNDCVHKRIAANAQTRPDAPAIDAWDGKLTHKELDDLATQLSYHLRALGVGPDVFVPLCFEKSMFALVAMLGVLKADGAFMLLDPGVPDQRMRQLCSQVGASVAVTSPTYRSRLSDFVPKGLVLDWEFFKTPVPSVPSHSHQLSDPRNAAYIIFTSGSTGVPKGVIIEHRSYCSAIISHHALNVNSNTRSLQFGSYNFAGAILEILMPLIHGGCVCILSDEERGAELAPAIRRLNANWAFLTSTVLAKLAPEDVPCLKTMCIGGEPIRSVQIQTWASKLELRQTYGSSELSGVVGSARLSDSSTPTDVGRALSGRIWLVDPNNFDRLAPLGVTGEIIFEGQVVGREYIGQPQKTAEAFIRTPAWRESFGPCTSRFYRTGDLAVYKNDGTVQLLGRKDTQVKLRGQRIEVGEVEQQARLATPDVQEVVVELTTTAESTRGPELVAFLVLRKSQEQSSMEEHEQKKAIVKILQQVQARLESVLPYYMVPSLLVPISELPLTASKKTDRKRLREMGPELSADLKLQELRKLAAAREKRKPRTVAERRLLGLWAEALDIDADSISIENSFFQLGGDSMAAMKLTGIARKMGISLPVANIFRNPTFAAQAQVLTSTAPDADECVRPFALVVKDQAVSGLRKELAALCDVEDSVITDAYPCTPLQTGLLSLTAKRDGEYIMQAVLDLPEGIQIDTFKAAWDAAVQTIAILRTRIVHHHQLELLQVVCDQEISWNQASDLETYLEQDKANAMGLGHSLSRYTIVDDGKPRQFVWTIHHALFDGWSLGLILNFVYNEYARVQSVKPAPFNSFVKYLRSFPDTEASKYWQLYLADGDFAPFPPLPPSVSEPMADATIKLELPPLALKAETATSSMLLRGALAILIHQYTGSSDVLLGATVSGRSAPVAGIDQIAGPTIATVPIRIQVDREQLVAEYLDIVQRDSTEMIPYEQTGLQRIAKIDTNGQEACKFQTLLVVHPQEGEDIAPNDTLGTWHTSSTNNQGFTTYAVTLECYLGANTVKVKASFDSRIISTWRMESLLRQLSFLVDKLSEADAGRSVRDVCSLTEVDVATISSWNNMAGIDVADSCVHDLIAKHARQQPDRPAVKAWDGSLSYVELEHLSDKLAYHLAMNLGVGPEVIVPLCFEKSMWTVVAILGTLKAGGAFVLLDSGLPDTRLETLCRQTKATISMASVSCKTRLSKYTKNTVMVDWELLRSLPDMRPAQPRSKPNNAAYIIFTSGSTGEPKGVIIEHRSYCSAAIGHGRHMNMSANTRALQFGSYNFAGAIMEMLMTMIYGGCICIPSEEQRGTQLVQTIRELDANWAFLTSTVLAKMNPEEVPSLKTINIGGEPIRSSQIKQWASHANRNLRQTYGSAETAAVVSSAALSVSSGTGDVGTATTGRYWIVHPDDHDDLVPIGAPGEVIIEGPTIGRHYIGDTERSAKAFISPPAWRNSFGSPLAASRFYKTGDLATYNQDGSIELLGRKDTQVKLRGQRIETGEVEYHARLSSPAVKDAVVELVKIQDSQSRGPELVGFLVIDTDGEMADLQKPGDEYIMNTSLNELTRTTIRRTQARLETVLPHWMVPSVFVPIWKLPLTVSGKTDRRRLRQMGAALSPQNLEELRTATRGAKRLPRTKAEYQLRALWSQTLGIEADSIGVDDSFFRLGGDSIAAMKLVGAARGVGISLAVADIFRNPVLSAQAHVEANSVQEIDKEPIAPFALLNHSHTSIDLRNEFGGLCGLEASFIDDAYPCTALQEGLLSLKGLQTAWEKVVSLTPILRTKIVYSRQLGALVQVVCNEGVNWERATNVDDYVRRDKTVPMGLGDRLSRLAFVDGDGKKPKFMVWTLHHALYDGFTIPLVLDMVGKAYRGDPILQRTEFNAFVKSTVQEHVTDDAAAYWQSYLANGEHVPFPTLPVLSKEPKADDSFEYTLPLNIKTTEATVSTLLRAATALMISQYTGSADVVFGATVSGRNAAVAGIEEIIGPTIATVPVRVQLREDYTVPDLLEKIQQQATEMIAYEQTGLHRIARMGEDCRHASAFNTLLVVQPEEKLPSDALGQWQISDNQEDFVTYALALECNLRPNEIALKACFDSAVVSRLQLEHMIFQLSSIVIQLADSPPDRRLGEINLLTAKDEATIWNWNQTVPETIEFPVHHIISRQEQQQPDSPAVSAWDGEISYKELGELSSRLAKYITSLGIGSREPGAENIVPLIFEKSKWVVVSMLAVLKAGAAFLLIDPDQAAGRRDLMLAEISAKIILTSKRNANILTNLDYNIVPVDADTLSSLPSANRTTHPKVQPGSAAYMVYTSGSTGQPKGILIEHCALASSTVYGGRSVNFDKKTRTLQFSSYSFDAYIMEILTTLVYGGCVCMPSSENRLADIDKTITDGRVNTIILTPCVVRLLKPATVLTLRTVVLCGETPMDEDLQRLVTVPELFNGYGPAECTVGCAFGQIDYSQASAYVGKAVGSVSWIVHPEDHDRLVPVGAIGELIVEGPIVARGYVGSPVGTAASFIEAPAWLCRGTKDHPGRQARLYKTGDLVRYTESGGLTYLGRKDMQIKIRGQRLELGEVEHQAQACLGPHAQVVAEMVRLNGDNQKAILSLFVAGDLDEDANSQDSFYHTVQISDGVELARASSALEVALAQRLPQYMIPSLYIRVAILPLSASGKVDRKRLRKIGEFISAKDVAEIRATGGQEKRQPTTEEERVLRKIWAQVLNLEANNIGIDDSLIRLGGDSISAMVIVGESRNLGFELGVADVLHPNGLHHLAQKARLSSDNANKVIPQTPYKGPVEQSYAQGRLWFLDQLYPDSTMYLMPLAMRVRGKLHLGALHAALLAIESRHETLRTTFTAEDGVDLQVVHPFKPSELKIVEIAEGNLLHTLRQEQNTPFNLESDAGWRITLYRLSEEDHVLSIVMHHIISDGWSVGVLQRELTTFYTACIHGLDPLSSVSPLPIQYRDYALWQKMQDQVDTHQKQLDYWVAELDNSQPAEFLCDKPRPDTLSGKAEVKEIMVEGPLYNELMQFCKRHEVTPFVVLLAAFRATHYRMTGSKDATIGTANANRDQAQVADLIGFFVNMQCLRLKLDDESFEQLVQKVQAAKKASLENQDVPFEKIVSKLKNTRDLARQPLVQVVFTLHSQTDLGQFNLEGVEIDSLNMASTSRFDLEFHFTKEDVGLRGEVAFSTDLFEPKTIDNMLSLFRTTLEHGLREPQIEIGSLPLMTEDAYATLQETGLIQPHHQPTHAPESSVVSIFRQQVTAYPNRIAVKDSHAKLTYSQLDIKSDELARWLTKQSFVKEKLVGVYSERSCQTIIAYLGILKAGLAYVPLDVRSPASRVESILSSVEGRRLVLLGRHAQPPSLDLEHLDFVGIDDILEHAQNGTNGHDALASCTPSSASLAYVMYTSGSTGKPKGVLIEHRGILRLARQNDIVKTLSAGCTMVHMGNIAFDITTWEIYPTILNGGTLICVDSTTVLDNDALIQIFKSEKVQTTILTPAFFKQFLVQAPSVFSQLELLLVGGDKVDGQDLAAAGAIMNGRIINAYGPTENTVISTFYDVPTGEEFTNGVPIGRAIGNSGAYVVDTDLRLVPIGVIGELVVTGDGLARGYMNPEQNANRFITLNIGGQQLRAYRTGDYVRYRPLDGHMEFFGRIDLQVKVRGHRIELGEIESALKRHAFVRDAVVVAEHRNEQATQLAGFVTIAEEDENEGGNADVDDDEAEQHVKLWETLFDSDKYTTVEDVRPESIGRDFTAWTSMYSGELIAKDEMNEWLDDTIRSIRNGGEPGNVLEVGTGTGMILFNIIDGLRSYVGLEPTSTAIEFVAKTARSIPGLQEKIYMQKGTGSDICLLGKDNSPELAVINSVAQYFPTQAYLFKVAKDLIQIKSMKRVFFGDMRSFALFDEFKVSKALHLFGKTALRDEVERHMAESDRVETELLVDPAFFTSLKDSFPNLVEHVEIIPKRMKATNELSSYRYSAILHLTDDSNPVQVHKIGDSDWIDFMEEGLDQQSLLQLLRQGCSAGSTVAVSNIPNSKSILERHVVNSLVKDSVQSANDRDWLPSIIREAEKCHSLSALDLQELAQSIGCRVEISWARQHSLRGGLDAVFHHHQPPVAGSRVLFNFPTDHAKDASRVLTSRPLRRQLTEKVRGQLHELVRDTLPSYMMPQSITVLDKMPVTENGKVDRRALVQTASKVVIPRGTKQQPTSLIGKQLQGIWAQVLYVDTSTIGIEDNFFQLGGDSIVAMKAVPLARDIGIELSVADIFRHPTLEALVESRKTATNGHVESVRPFALFADSQDIRKEVAVLCDTDSSTVEDAYPCTSLQEGLLSLTAKRPGDYVMQAIFQISPDVDIVRFKSAWEYVVASTRILRTRIVEHEQLGVIQVVTKEGIAWSEGDELEEYLRKDATDLMGIGKRLSRFAIVTEHDVSQSRCLVWTIHHALYDGWMLSRVMSLVHDTYNGNTALTEQPGFNVFVKHLLDARSSDAEAYWQSYLADAEFVPFPTPPALPFYEPVADAVLETGLAPRVKSEFTMSTMINAALGILISQYTNVTDVIFGTVLSGRDVPLAGIEDIMGPTIATVPTRIRPHKGHTVREYLQTIQKQNTEAAVYQQTGLQRISSMGENGRRGCGFQTLLAIQPEDEGLSEDHGLGSWKTSSASKTLGATYALLLECLLGADEVRVRASFDTRVISKWQMENFTQQLGFIIKELAAAKPGQLVEEVGSLTLENEITLWNWNKTVPVAIERLLHESISKQAKIHPDTPAVDSWDGKLSYQELDALAGRVAEHLIALGVGDGIIVPLFFEKSIWGVVAMLAILKAGGAFVGMDTSQATDRRERILNNINAKVVLTSIEHADILGDSKYAIVPVGPRALSTTTNPTRKLASSNGGGSRSGATIDSTAYLMFTSGSTGQPKGVRISHLAASTSCFHHGRAFGFSASTRTLQFAAYTFDIGFTEIFTTLLFGGCVCVPSDDERLTAIEASINRMNVNLCFLTPTVSRLIRPSQVPSVTKMLLGGEKITDDDINRWRSPTCTFFNVYGPTETAVVSNVGNTSTGSRGGSWLGHATGACLWVVSPDDPNRLMPIGAVGELAIEGHIVGQGYLNRPQETAAAFIDSPEWLLRGTQGRPGRKSLLYRSGDLVKYNEDGTLDFVGRKDNQAKMRGLRIELNEVDFQVRESVPDAAQAVAEVTELAGESNRPILSVFLRTEKDDNGPDGFISSPFRAVTSITENVSLVWLHPETEAAISQRLPPYMVPTLYFLLKKLPLNISGKVDRRKLREIVSSLSPQKVAELKSLAKGGKRAPRTQTEETLQRLWAQILDISGETIGVDDSFLGIGGDSITAMRLVVSARKAGIALTVMDILKHGSLETLAAYQDKKTGETQPRLSVEPFSLLDPAQRSGIIQWSSQLLKNREIDDIYPLTGFQRDVIKMSLQRPQESLNYIFIDFSANLDVDRLKSSCHSVVERYSLLRSAFIEFKGTYFQASLAQLPLQIPVLETTEDITSVSEKLCLQDAESGFRLGRSPTAFMLVRSKSQGHRLVLRLSHLQYDGFCLPTLITAVLNIYRGVAPPPVTQFSEFLGHKRDRLAASLTYWRRLLQGSSLTNISEILIPEDRRAGVEARPREKIIVEDSVLVPQLPAGITLASVVSAAWAIILARLTGTRDIIYGSLVSGRDVSMPGIENVVGPCLDIVPVRAQLSSHQTSFSLLRSIQEQNLAAQSHSLGLDEIIKHSVDWPVNSDFDTTVQHQNTSDESAEFKLDGETLKMSWLDNPNQVPPRMVVMSYPARGGVRIQIVANSHIIPAAAAKALLAALCDAVGALTETQDQKVSSLIERIGSES
ncbi:hypothetical protein F5B22DRAFT_653082 [Xylaria bambusicola]|uniref:uncharacterized protein n=1 Tax=Xylaria bambusicola TaxID=326684 RepID=UPI002008D4C1|nr:uncharacterized protein F5B22DRAFT_653082 [Xylaria bambusicola]KAI0527995.1 hypothetical protein F5B22DRAFT_653082 [Xylaria bambusicola]